MESELFFINFADETRGAAELYGAQRNKTKINP